MIDNIRFEHIMVIRDEILSNPEVESLTIWNAAKLAEEDNYLYDLFIDYMKEVDYKLKDQMLLEIIDYTDETLRPKG